MDQIEQDILKWYNKDLYTRIGSDVSVTELLNPPRVVHLRNKYRPQVFIGSMDQVVPSLTGNGLHDQLQKFLRRDAFVTGKWKIERHVLGVINGYRVTGRFDALYDDKILYDIKTTRSWKFEKGDFTEWEEQLNIYDYLLWKDGIHIQSLKVMGVVLDWQQGKVWKQGYPSGRIQIVPITKWSRTDQEKFVLKKVDSWSKSLGLAPHQLPLCGPKDRWAGSSEWKLYRTNTSKRATKKFPSLNRAQAYLKACVTRDKAKWTNSHIIQVQSNPWNRCEKWCDVSKFCNQFKNKIEK